MSETYFTRDNEFSKPNTLVNPMECAVTEAELKDNSTSLLATHAIESYISANCW